MLVMVYFVYFLILQSILLLFVSSSNAAVTILNDELCVPLKITDLSKYLDGLDPVEASILNTKIPVTIEESRESVARDIDYEKIPFGSLIVDWKRLRLLYDLIAPIDEELKFKLIIVYKILIIAHESLLLKSNQNNITVSEYNPTRKEEPSLKEFNVTAEITTQLFTTEVSKEQTSFSTTEKLSRVENNGVDRVKDKMLTSKITTPESEFLNRFHRSTYKLDDGYTDTSMNTIELKSSTESEVVKEPSESVEFTRNTEPNSLFTKLNFKSSENFDFTTKLETLSIPEDVYTLGGITPDFSNELTTEQNNVTESMEYEKETESIESNSIEVRMNDFSTTEIPSSSELYSREKIWPVDQSSYASYGTTETEVVNEIPSDNGSGVSFEPTDSVYKEKELAIDSDKLSNDRSEKKLQDKVDKIFVGSGSRNNQTYDFVTLETINENDSRFYEDNSTTEEIKPEVKNENFETTILSIEETSSRSPLDGESVVEKPHLNFDEKSKNSINLIISNAENNSTKIPSNIGENETLQPSTTPYDIFETKNPKNKGSTNYEKSTEEYPSGQNTVTDYLSTISTTVKNRKFYFTTLVPQPEDSPSPTTQKNDDLREDLGKESTTSMVYSSTDFISAERKADEVLKETSLKSPEFTTESTMNTENGSLSENREPTEAGVSNMNKNAEVKKVIRLSPVAIDHFSRNYFSTVPMNSSRLPTNVYRHYEIDNSIGSSDEFFKSGFEKNEIDRSGKIAGSPSVVKSSVFKPFHPLLKNEAKIRKHKLPIRYDKGLSKRGGHNTDMEKSFRWFYRQGQDPENSAQRGDKIAKIRCKNISKSIKN